MTIGGLRRFHRTQFWDRDLEVREDFRADKPRRLRPRRSSFVDQEHRRAPATSGLEPPANSGRLDQIAVGENVGGYLVAVVARRRLPPSRMAIICAGAVPLIDGGGDVEGPRSIAVGSACAPAPPTNTLAISVLPTPASPSRKQRPGPMRSDR